MTEPTVWKGLADVRPRPDADFEGAGAAEHRRRIAGGLGPDRPVWCRGTFYLYEQDDDA